MGMRLAHLVALALGGGLLAAGPADAEAGTYDYVVIADSADGFQPSQLGCPALNNAGEVAFRARSTEGEDQLLRGSGGDLTTIADESDMAGIGNAPSINSAGQVSFRGVLDDGTVEIYRGDGTVLRKVATTLKRFDDLALMTSINDAGLVAFDAQMPGRNAGLFWGEFSPRSHRVYSFAKSDFRGDGDAFSGPSLGDGEIAFSSLRAGAPDGVFRQTRSGELTTIAQTDDTVYKFRGVSLNAGGEVAFTAFKEGGVQAIMVGSGGPLRTVVDTSGPFEGLGSTPPSLNDSGTVAFTAFLEGQAGGVYLGPDPVADRVVGPGEVIAGSTVEDVSACDEALNELGQVAFWADLTDGRRVIVRADPV